MSFDFLLVFGIIMRFDLFEEEVNSKKGIKLKL